MSLQCKNINKFFETNRAKRSRFNNNTNLNQDFSGNCNIYLHLTKTLIHLHNSQIVNIFLYAYIIKVGEKDLSASFQ